MNSVFVKPSKSLAFVAIFLCRLLLQTAQAQPSISGHVDFSGSLLVNSNKLATATKVQAFLTTDVAGGTGTYAAASPFGEGVNWGGGISFFVVGPQEIDNLWQFTNSGSNYTFSLSSITSYTVNGADTLMQVVGTGTVTASGSASTIGNFTLAISDPTGGNSGMSDFQFAASVIILSWSNPPPIIYGTPLNSNQLDAAVVGVPGAFAYTPTNGAVLSTGTNTLSVTFIPSNTNNYGRAATNVSLTVTPATLTVTAANASRAVGQSNPVFTGTITGLASGDNITAVYNTAATTNSPAGTYPITPTLVDPGNRLTNYQVTLVNGTLTIGAALAAPVIQSASQSGGLFTFTWSAITNQTYQIRATTNLAPAHWTNLGGAFTATNSTMTSSEPMAAAGQQFYQVVLVSGAVISTPPVIQSASLSGGSFIFTWSALSNRTYQVQATPNLSPVTWTNLGGTISATNSLMTISEPTGTNAQQFYQVVLLP